MACFFEKFMIFVKPLVLGQKLYGTIMLADFLTRTRCCIGKGLVCNFHKSGQQIKKLRLQVNSKRRRGKLENCTLGRVISFQMTVTIVNFTNLFSSYSPVLIKNSRIFSHHKSHNSHGNSRKISLLAV